MKYWVFVLMLGSLFQNAKIEAGEISVAWDRNLEQGVTYKVYASPLPGARTNFTAVVDAGTNTVARVPAGNPGVPAFYVVTANLDALESEPSNEISWLLPVIAIRPSPQGLLISWTQAPIPGNTSYFLESSPDLTTWVRELRFLPIITPLPGGIEAAVVTIPTEAPREFYRVAIEIR